MWDAQGGRWEKLGTSQATFEPITADQMDAIVAGTDTDEGGSEVMTRWGLRYWLTKLRGVFAALVHTHSASDITSGTFGTARIADGAVTKNKLEKTLGDSLSRKLTVGAALDGASLNANTELNRPFQITGTSALGHLTFIVSLSSISLFNHDTGQTIGSIPWK